MSKRDTWLERCPACGRQHWVVWAYCRRCRDYRMTKLRRYYVAEACAEAWPQLCEPCQEAERNEQ